ncbi:helix-turn-helix transcriptional regulator [Marinobacter segnicrescens]|uniref:helix-turn-helix transcriptional regulator n=1 Tax=Marinobacter segnicrescens TaxID=430453 RepID=UPI000B823E2C|nr:AlpA family phage regulatory protein [Marinobacter segnicrescens]
MEEYPRPDYWRPLNSLFKRTVRNGGITEKRGEFPRRIALTSRNVAWDLSEVEQWIEERKSSGIQATRPGNTIGA